MQLLIHGQWWSNRATQRSHVAQCLDLIGLRTKQLLQNHCGSKPPDSANSIIVYKQRYTYICRPYIHTWNILHVKITRGTFNLSSWVAVIIPGSPRQDCKKHIQRGTDPPTNNNHKYHAAWIPSQKIHVIYIHIWKKKEKEKSAYSLQLTL